MTTAKQVARLLRDQTRKVAIILHRQPDGDAIGSAIALANALGHKKVKFFCVTPLPTVFIEALGSIKVETDLIISAHIYIVLDCPDRKRTGFDDILTKVAKNRSIIVIDHHQPGDLGNVANDYLCDRTASSTCEVVAAVIDELRCPISPNIATALLLGIHTDTGGLQYANTTSQTLALVSRLIRLGADIDRIRRLFSRQLGLKKLKLWGLILGSVSINSLGIAVARVTKALLTETDASEQDLLGLAKYLCSIEGTKAALVLVETSSGWRGSLRTRSQTFNVGHLAKLLGGNGGQKVAGFVATEQQISGTIVGEPASLAIKKKVDNTDN